MTTLLLRQQITLVANRWELSRLRADQTEETLGFVRQKVMSLREAVRCESADGAEVFTIRGRNVLELRGRYDIMVGDDIHGQLRKMFGRSLFRSTYELEVSGQVFTITERSLPFALARRTIGDLLPFWPLPIHFDIVDCGGKVVGSINRRFSVRDVYVGTVEEDLISSTVAGAAMIAVDAFMGR